MNRPLRTLPTYLAARLLPALAAMVFTLLCIHALPPEHYANYSLALLAAGVASGFVGGASGQPMLRYSHELAPSALRTALLSLPLIVSALAVPLVLVYIAVTSTITRPALIAVATIPLLALMDTRRSLFVARGRANAVLALDGSRSMLALLAGAVLLHLLGARAEAPLIAQVVAIVTCLVLVRGRATDGPHGTREVDGSYCGYGLGIAGWMAAIVALSLAERSVLAEVVGLASSGRYAAQADVVNAVFAAGASALASTMMPAYLAQTESPTTAALRRLRRLGVLGCLAIVPLCVAAGALTTLLPGVRVAQVLTADVPTALVLIAAAAVWSSAGFVQKPIELRGQTHQLFACVVVALLLFLLIAPTLAERFAAPGVAMAKLAAGVAYTLLAGRAARAPRTS